MSAVALHGRKPSMDLKLPPALDRRFEAVDLRLGRHGGPRSERRRDRAAGADRRAVRARARPDRDHRHARRQRRRAAWRAAERARAPLLLRQPRLRGLRGERGRARARPSDGRRRRRRTRRSTRPRRPRWPSSARRGVTAEIVSRATEPAQDRPDPRAGVGRPAEGADRGAARGGAGASARGRTQRVSATPSRSRLRAARSAGRRRSARDERRQARRDRAHRQGGCGALGVRGACAPRDRAWPRADRGRRVRAARRPAGQRLLPARAGGRAGDGASRSGRSRAARRRRSSRSAAGRTLFVARARRPARTPPPRDVPELDGDPRLDARRRRARPAAGARARITAHARRRAARNARRAALRPPALRPAVLLSGRLRRRRVRTPSWPRAPTGRALVPRSSEAGRGSARRLDLATGLLREDGRVTSLRFSSLARPGTVALRAQANPAVVACAPAAAPRARAGRCAPSRSAARPRPRAPRRLRRAIAERRAGGARRRGAGGLRTAAARAPGGWASRWQEADVVIEGDPELQRAVRFALFHLMASVGDADEAAVGARGLSGTGLPRPRLLGQRRLRAALPRGHASGGRAGDARVPRAPSARRARARRARSAGPGARFAWESAGDGRDVTPSLGAARHRRARPHPHGRARGAHRR